MKEQIFEWDENKASSNYRKHGIKFEDAIEVFDDPYCIYQQDRIVDGEYRWQAIGYTSDGILLLLVAYTLRERDDTEVIRIISARQATRPERKRYGNRTV